MVAARKLHRRAERTATGRFLVEGAQAVREALATATVHELFVTAAAEARHQDLVAAAAVARVPVSPVTDRAAAALSDTVTPQGLVAVCDTVTVALDEALRTGPRLVAVLAGVSDPGNAGTVIRVADAAGAGAVVLAGDAVDPHNGKCVRATAGSLFHLPVAVHRDLAGAVDALRANGLRVLAGTGRGRLDLEEAADAGLLDGRTAWVFGSEAHGLDGATEARADETVRVPIHGAAESLNLATAAAVCLYASARAARHAASVVRPPSAFPVDE
ncbi:MAG TPA: RNA methyltransferase [Pseudonocardiaceae bacterium]